MDSPTPNAFEFGDFRLDRRRRLLADADGRPIRITAKAFDTLVYFLEHPGVVIDRSALLEAVWPKSIVEENNLSQAVAALRRVLGTGFIATVERQGYQFVADVRAIADVRVVADEAGRRPRIAIGAVLGLLVVVALLTAYLRERPVPQVAVEATTAGETASNANAASTGVPKVVVLPCDNLSPDPNDAYLAAGLHIEILNRLANLSGLLVAARTSVLQYSAARPPVRQIASELNAAAVMECSVRRAGDSILVTAQLVDPATDAPLWSKSYPGDLSNVDGLFAMQVGIAESIASSLGAKLLPAEQLRLEQRPTRSPEAYALYLKALEVAGTGVNPYEYLDRAVAADPEFAWAFARRADFRTVDAGFLPTLTGPFQHFSFDRFLELAREDANRALAIDPRLGLAHAVLARASTLEGNASAAQQSYERALELTPNDAEILRSYAEFQIVAGRAVEALELIERAERVDPNNLRVSELLALGGERDAAGEAARRAAERDPTNPLARLYLGYLEILRGDIPAARDHLRLAEQLLGAQPRGMLRAAQLYLAYGYGRVGLTGDAQRLVEQHPADAWVPRIAWVYGYLGAGDLERAHEWASRVAENGLLPAINWERAFMLNLLDDPVLEQPEFLALRRQLGYRE
jgi:TolB-like protein/DNA-binding winged helix-turn-helix (wHTH) protein